MTEETYLIVLFAILAVLLIFAVAVGVVSIVSSKKFGKQLELWERKFRQDYERKLGEDWNRCMFGNKEGILGS